MDGFLSIAEVAKRTGLSAHTPRYYERAVMPTVPHARQQEAMCAKLGCSCLPRLTGSYLATCIRSDTHAHHRVRCRRSSCLQVR
jgi:hypothetical protein